MCGLIPMLGLKGGGVKGAASAALGGLAGLALSKGKKKPEPAPTAATSNMASL